MLKSFILFSIIFCYARIGFTQNEIAHTSAQSAGRIIKSTDADFKSFPDGISYIVVPYYRHRADGKPGREITFRFKDPAFYGSGSIEAECLGAKQIIHFKTNSTTDTVSFLLPDGAGVQSDCITKIKLKIAGKEYRQNITVPAKRHWTIYIYPHSHVDIGYTNTQANVEIIHKRNLVQAMKLAEKTASYPKDARYHWNPEVLWPVERYLRDAGKAARNNLIAAIQKGYIHLDAGYVNMNTSTANGEELYQYFRFRNSIAKLTGTKIETMVQVDVPGMSWGIVPVAASLGIKYCFALNNGIGRVGKSIDLSFKPFWWLGADGKSKILFLQPGSYRPGAEAKGHNYWPSMAGQTDTSKLLQVIKTDHPRQNFVDNYLATELPILEKSNYYPYDIFAMSWAMADNTPIDADLPDAVKSWNEDYAFPHLIIAGATQIMKAFERKYGDQLPVMKGDFTEYWTDGLGTAAKQTSMNRSSKERLIEAETLWAMLHPAKPSPRSIFNDAWRNVIMADEHTWCFMDPSKQPITNDILKVKFGFFEKAQRLSDTLLGLALSGIAEKESPVIGVFNTLSWARKDMVIISADQSKNYNSVTDTAGEVVRSQRLSTGELAFYTNNIPAFGSAKYYLKNKEVVSTGKLAYDNVLDNGILHAIIDTITGDISSFTKQGYEFADRNSKASLNSYRYLHGDDNSDLASGTKNIKLRIKENGPLIATIQVMSEAEGCNKLVREISMIAGDSVLRISNFVDKKAVLEKEGIHFGFGFNIPGSKTHADIPWSVMELEKDQLPGANRNWITFQRWLDISNKKNGITWCSLDAPLFECDSMTANILGSGANSTKWLSKINPGATIYSWAMNNHWHTNFPLSQEGLVEFRYRILPHNFAYDAASANHFGMEQSQPLIAVPVKKDFKETQLMKISGSEYVVASIVNSNETGFQIRVRSVSEQEEKIKFSLSMKKQVVVTVSNSTHGQNVVGQEILVPANGLVTLNVLW